MKYLSENGLSYLISKIKNTYVKTDDARLTNARTPVAHTHSATEIKYGTNLPFTVKKNVYINNSNGAEISYSGWDDTDFIDIGSATKIFCNINNQWGAWYKSDQSFLSSANFTNRDYLDVPTNAKYIRVSGTASAIASLSITTSASTVASAIEDKADKSEIPDVSGFMKPIVIETGKDGTTYASGVWTVTKIASWDDVMDGQLFVFPIATSDSSAKKISIGGVQKSLYRTSANTVTSHYGTGAIICCYSATKGALYTSDYDSNNWIWGCTTSAGTVAKVISNPLGTSYVPVVGELFPVYISQTNTANNPTCQSKPIFVEDVKVETSNKGILVRGSYMAYLDADGLYLTHQGLPKKYIDTLPYLKEHQDITGKQDKLTAGTNITITGNVISASGGSSGTPFTLTDIDNMYRDSAQYYWAEGYDGGPVVIDPIGGGDDGPVIIF